MKYIISVFIIALFVFGVISAVSMQAEATPPVIRILPDGSIYPPDVPIKRYGNVYTFTENIYARIVVDRDDIVIDGAGYTLYGNYNGTRTDSWIIGQGPNQINSESLAPWSIGIDLANKNRRNLTVRNLNIKNFHIGIYVWTANNIIVNCAVTNCIVGILLSGDSNKIIRNYIACNEMGIFFGVNKPENEPLNIVLSHNSFINNVVHFSGCSCKEYSPNEPIHTWDNGKEGNYWDDYNGIDANGDGIGDVPYIIDQQNQDRFPLMQGVATPPTPMTSTSSISATAIIMTGVMVAALTLVSAASYMRKIIGKKVVKWLS
ncbi:MAG: NosD domain-containing protein [Candidatus Bathyarchaeia archaeon]